MKPVRPIAVRFWEKVDKSGGLGACWLWTGAPDVNGYGKLWWFDHANKGKFAHRLSWELHFGPIPECRRQANRRIKREMRQRRRVAA